MERALAVHCTNAGRTAKLRKGWPRSSLAVGPVMAFSLFGRCLRWQRRWRCHYLALLPASAPIRLPSAARRREVTKVPTSARRRDLSTDATDGA